MYNSPLEALGAIEVARYEATRRLRMLNKIYDDLRFALQSDVSPATTESLRKLSNEVANVSDAFLDMRAVCEEAVKSEVLW